MEKARFPLCLLSFVISAALAAVSAPADAGGEPRWTWCGWGGGGWFWCSAADPADGDVFYMGGDVNGIWKTEDAGCTWRFVNRGLGNYAVYSLAVAPSDARRVYALTGNGVAVSTNAAASWTMCAGTASGALKVLANRGGSVHAVAVDPTDPLTVYAGGASGRAVKSTDGGATWTTLRFAASEPSGSPVTAIAVSGRDAKVVLLCEQKLGLFRSTDGGATWSAVSGAPSKPRAVYWAGPNAPKTWYGAFDSNGAWVSRDDALTWTSLGAPASGRPARDVACSRQDPSVVHVVFTSGFNSHTATTRDGGATWKTVSKLTLDHAANPTLPGNGATINLSGIENICVSPVNANHIHLPGNWDPCFSHDAGASWFESCRGADITCFHDLRLLDGAAYGAAMDEGTCMTADAGASWTALAPRVWTPGLSGHHWRVLPQKLADGRTRVISAVSPWDDSGIKYPAKVIWSEDGGKTFAEATGLPATRPLANSIWGEGHPRALAADPNDPDVVYLGIDGDPDASCPSGGGVFKSTDGGKSFVQLPNQPGSRIMFYGLAVDPTDSERVVWGACGANSGVYVSSDGGGSWAKASGTSDWIYDVLITPSGVIYASGGQLYRSTDHGRSFKTVSKFARGSVTGVAVDPANEDRVWVAVTSWGDNVEGGVYASADGCATWQDVSGDIPFRNPRVVRYDPATGELWAAGNGVYRLQVDGRGGEPESGDDEPVDGMSVWTGRGGDGDWHNAANWLGGVPGADSDAVFSNAVPVAGSTVAVTGAAEVARLVFARAGAMTLAASGAGSLRLGGIEREGFGAETALVTVAVPLAFAPDGSGECTLAVAAGGLRLAGAATAGDGLLRVVKTGAGDLELAAKGAVPAGKLAILAGTVSPTVDNAVTGKLVVGGGTEKAEYHDSGAQSHNLSPEVCTNGTFYAAGDLNYLGADNYAVHEGGYVSVKSTYGGKFDFWGGSMKIGYRFWNGGYGQHIGVHASGLTARLEGEMDADGGYDYPITVEDGARPIDFVFKGGGVAKGSAGKTLKVTGAGTMQTFGSWGNSYAVRMTSVTWLMDNAGKTRGSGKGSLTVGEGATLGGVGVFGGDAESQVLTVAGASGKVATLAPGTMTEEGAHVYGTFTVGTASVTNALVFGARSRLVLNVGDAGAHDALAVFGPVAVGAAETELVVAVPQGFDCAALKGAGPIPLVTATGAIEGGFATVTLPEGSGWRVRRTARALELVTSPEHPPFAVGGGLAAGTAPVEVAADGSVRLRVGGTCAGWTYLLESATDLAAPVWTPVEGASAASVADDAAVELVAPPALTAGRSALFFRVRAVLP